MGGEKKKYLVRGVILLSCFLAGVSSGVFLIDRFLYRGRIIPGVRVGEIDLSRLTPAAAERKLVRAYTPTLKAEIRVKGPGQEWRFTPEELGVTLDFPGLAAGAFRVGRTGNPFENVVTRLRIARRGVTLTPSFAVQEKKLWSAVQAIRRAVEKPARDARLEVTADETVRVIPSREGRQLEINELFVALKKAALAANSTEREVPLRLRTISPRLRTQTVLSWGITHRRATYSTRFNPLDENRTHNIKMAARKLDGLILQPGEIFSFNRRVGDRGLKGGYREAPVIIKGKLVPGLGGGVCQVSTTLYNAVLLANLRIIKRAHHTLPSAYVPIGRDATVAYDYLDLQFLNNSSRPILLKTWVNGDRLRVSIYGQPLREDIAIEVVEEELIPQAVVKISDPSLKPGEVKVEESGYPGHRVSVWRVIKKEGREVVRELISRDYYKPVSTRLRVGATALTPEKESL